MFNLQLLRHFLGDSAAIRTILYVNKITKLYLAILIAIIVTTKYISLYRFVLLSKEVFTLRDNLITIYLIAHVSPCLDLRDHRASTGRMRGHALIERMHTSMHRPTCSACAAT